MSAIPKLTAFVGVDAQGNETGIVCVEGMPLFLAGTTDHPGFTRELCVSLCQRILRTGSAQRSMGVQSIREVSFVRADATEVRP
jgi:hypothetical protein